MLPPLLRAFGRLREDRVPFRITLSISPTLAAMLTDELLQNRYLAHLKMQQELAARETERVRKEPQFIPVVRMYKELIDENLYDFTETYRKNILKGFKSFEKEGYIDIITTAATHSFLPLYRNSRKQWKLRSIRPVISHGRIYRKGAFRFWLPECGYNPVLEKHPKQTT
jgi:1,4-alpha-glucan branching enzyme